MTTLTVAPPEHTNRRAKRHPDLVARVERITVQRARDLLTYHNPRNRPISPARVRRYAAAMSGGRWKFNGEAIQIDWWGDLLNGQHRLLAIHLSGLDQDILVVYGVDPARFDTYDQTRVRTPGDALGIAGHKHPGTLAAAGRIVLAYERTGAPIGDDVRPDTGEIEDVLKRHNIEASMGIGTKGILGVSRASVVALHYLFSSADRLAADEFFITFRQGLGLRTGDPVLALRNRLTSELQKKTKPKPALCNALVVRGWNGWHSGERLARLLMLDGFPAIVGCTVPILGEPSYD